MRSRRNKWLAFICAVTTATSGLAFSIPYNAYADEVKVDSEKTDNGFMKEPGEEDGEGLEEIQLPENGLSYYGYNIDEIKAASDENTAKRFIQIENELKENFPFSPNSITDLSINEDNLFDDVGDEIDVDENTLQSAITLFTLSYFKSYILKGSSDNLADYFKSKYDKSNDLCFFSDYTDDEISKFKEILSDLKEPIRHTEEVS